ncbi:hypothetical protein ACQJBY_036288 [Aegilops geniculata]
MVVFLGERVISVVLGARRSSANCSPSLRPWRPSPSAALVGELRAVPEAAASIARQGTRGRAAGPPSSAVTFVGLFAAFVASLSFVPEEKEKKHICVVNQQ